MGAMPGRVGGKARKKLCASVTSISLVVFNERATIVLAIDKGAADVYDDNRKRKKPRSGTREKE